MPEAQPPASNTLTTYEWPTDTAKIRIAVSIPPQKEFIERIGGDRVHVISMLSASENFESAALDERRQRLLDGAQIFLTIGAGFERGLTIPTAVKVIDMRNDVRMKPFTTHTRYLNGEKNHQQDPFFWMSPALVVSSLSNVYMTLREMSPADNDYFSQNYTRLVRTLNSLEGDINRIVVGLNGREIYTDYPALGYFSDAFGFTQVLFQQQEGKDLNDLARSAITDKVQIIFFGPYLPGGIDSKLGNLIKGEVAALNPLAENYFDNMLAIATAIRDGYGRR